MRNRFDEELFDLNKEIIEMGAMCEEAIKRAVEALKKHDIRLANNVKNGSTCIDQMERQIENRCLKLLLHEQPVARDLRLISASLKMITDMERIGDQAEDIAEIVTFLDVTGADEIDKLCDMADKAIKMVSDSVDAFVRKDLELAENVISADDVVDNCFSDMKCVIIKWISKHAASGEDALDFLMIAKYLERIADHATNIAEWVIYSINGTHPSKKV